MTVHQLFNELDALELLQLSILTRHSVQGCLDFPWLGEDIGVFDGGFVSHGVGASLGEALGYYCTVADEVTSAVQPGLAVLGSNFDNQGITVPTRPGLTHPGVDGG